MKRRRIISPNQGRLSNLKLTAEVEDAQTKLNRVSKGIQDYLTQNGCILRTQTIIEGATVTSRAFVDLAQPVVRDSVTGEIADQTVAENTVPSSEQSNDTVNGN